ELHRQVAELGAHCAAHTDQFTRGRDDSAKRGATTVAGVRRDLPVGILGRCQVPGLRQPCPKRRAKKPVGSASQLSSCPPFPLEVLCNKNTAMKRAATTSQTQGGCAGPRVSAACSWNYQNRGAATGLLVALSRHA